MDRGAWPATVHRVKKIGHDSSDRTHACMFSKLTPVRNYSARKGELVTMCVSVCIVRDLPNGQRSVNISPCEFQEF